MSQIQDVKAASDIVQIIGERVNLQRTGANWKGLCPFHSEKSPSFFVGEQMQRYKCFGCGESGDVFTFLEKYEGMTFAEALQYLADRAGITLSNVQFTSEDDQRKRVLEILNLAKEYYHYLLTEHKAGEKAREYLKDRGATQDTIKIFQLGYAMPSWDGLIKYLHQKKKYELRDIEAAGLIISGNSGRPYDRFRDRLMFPLTDHRGRVVGFSGRVLDKDTKEAKYINTPETMVYHKSQMLFGFSQLYQFIRKENEVIVVEGEFDVLSSAQAHVNHVVAVKGSALTEVHAKLLSRTVQRVILCFDMDDAGTTATKRAIEVAKPFGLELRVLQLPPEAEAKDPDDIARTNPKLWREAVKSTISVYDFLISAALRKHNPKTPEGQREIIDEVAPVLGHISHAVELEFYIGKLAEKLHVREEIVRADLARFKNLKRRGFGSAKASSSATSPKQPTSKPSASSKPTRKSKLEDYVVFLLFQSPPDQVVKLAELLKHITFSRPGLKQIIQQLAQWSMQFEMSRFSQSLAEDLQQTLFDVAFDKTYLELLPNSDLEKEWSKSVKELINLDISEEISRITKELDELEQKPSLSPEDEQKQNELLRKTLRLRAKQKQV